MKSTFSSFVIMVFYFYMMNYELVEGFKSWRQLSKILTTKSTQQCLATIPGSETTEISGKSVTKEIMAYFNGDRKYENDINFKSRLQQVDSYLDGMHMLTILFQCARSRRLAKSLIAPSKLYEKLLSWKVVWSERDISTFVYGVKSLEGIDSEEGKILLLGAAKIHESEATLSSRSIGNALYGLQDISSSTIGAAELCEALAEKISKFNGDLIGQDIGIGLYGLQGFTSDVPQVRHLIDVLADKITQSESELDAQALSNALYGIQSFSSDYKEVLKLVQSLATKISDSSPVLSAQAIGSALYGLQKLSSDKLEVRTLVAALAEKVTVSTENLDAQAIGNALFGLQRMKSTSAEVRTLVQALADKLRGSDTELDSKAIGSSIYGLHSMSSDVPQVRSLLSALAVKIEVSRAQLTGQGLADALYGLSAMNSDCEELRHLLTALNGKIDSNRGKLDSQEIGNAIFGFSGLSSEIAEVRQLAVKIGEKLRRSTAILRSQHIGRALLGLQRLSADTLEIRYLLKQISKRIAASDRTEMAISDLTDSLFGLQGMASNIPEVQELIGEIAKKVASSPGSFSPKQLGRALFGLQGLSSTASIFQDTAIGIDSDEVTFLLSAIADKIQVMKYDKIPLSSIAMGLQGLTFLNDPISKNIKQYLYNQLVKMEDSSYLMECQRYEIAPLDTSMGAVATRAYIPSKSTVAVTLPNSALISTGTTQNNYKDPTEVAGLNSAISIEPINVIQAYRSLQLNTLNIPPWLERRYRELESNYSKQPIVPFNRQEKLVSQKYGLLYNDDKFIANSIIDGFRLDFNFESLKLNVELDGPSHRFPARRRFDKQRDEFLKVKKGYTVIRVQLSDKSVEAVTAEIRTIVMDFKEKLAELEIQNLYLSDDSLQKLYAPKK